MRNPKEKVVYQFVVKGVPTLETFKEELRQAVRDYNAGVEYDKQLDPDGVFDTPLRIGTNLPLFLHRCFSEYSVRNSGKRTHKALYNCFVGNPDEATWRVRKSGELVKTEREYRKMWNSHDYESDQAQDYAASRERFMKLNRQFLRDNNTPEVLHKLNNFVLVKRLYDGIPIALFEQLKTKFGAIKWE